MCMIQERSHSRSVISCKHTQVTELSLCYVLHAATTMFVRLIGSRHPVLI